MRFRRLWVIGVLAMVGAVGVVFESCSSSNGATSGNGEGVCQASCPKACSVDNDCDTSNGQLCCDYTPANEGKWCQAASTCPRFCSSDSTCDTSQSQACVRWSLQTTQEVCETPSAGLRLCSQDSDCNTGTNSSLKCCTIYGQGICEPANECPTPCSTSSDCNTANSEICCTSLKMEEPSLTAAGLCVNPAYTPCPKQCSQSADCTDPSAGVCCNGLCAATCSKSCTSDTQCTDPSAAICCQAPKGNGAPVAFFTGPTCSGTPLYSTCATCGAGGFCDCAGCTTPGSCTGTTMTCEECGTVYSCNPAYCAGCTMGDAGAGGAVWAVPVISTRRRARLAGCTGTAARRSAPGVPPSVPARGPALARRTTRRAPVAGRHIAGTRTVQVAP